MIIIIMKLNECYTLYGIISYILKGTYICIIIRINNNNVKNSSETISRKTLRCRVFRDVIPSRPLTASVRDDLRRGKKLIYQGKYNARSFFGHGLYPCSWQVSTQNETSIGATKNYVRSNILFWGEFALGNGKKQRWEHRIEMFRGADVWFTPNRIITYTRTVKYPTTVVFVLENWFYFHVYFEHRWCLSTEFYTDFILAYLRDTSRRVLAEQLLSVTKWKMRVLLLFPTISGESVM